MKKVISLVLSILLLLTLAGCKPAVVTQGSLEPGKAGRAVLYNDYIYYINGAPNLYMPPNFHNVTAGALYRMKPDGTDKEVVVPMITTIFNIGDDSIFFVAMNTGSTFVMAKCKLDGTEYKELGAFKTGTFQYTDGGLYFDSDGLMAYMDFNGSNKHTIIDQQYTSYVMDSKNIFYLITDSDTQKSIYCVDAQGKNKQLLFQGTPTLLYAKDGKVYFTLDDGLVYAIDAVTKKQSTILYTSYESQLLDVERDQAFGAGNSTTKGINKTIISTGVTIKIANVYATDLALGKDNIYFVNNDDNKYIYRAAIDGSGIQKMASLNVYDEKMLEIDGYLYFVEKEQQHLYRINISTLALEDITVQE